MKSYLVPGLDSGQKQKLKAAGIQYYEWDEAILIEDNRLQDALNVLGATATETATEYENMSRLSLRYRPAAKKAAPPPVTQSARAKSREKYVQACSSRSQQQLKDTAQITASRQQQLPNLQDRFFQAVRLSGFAKNSDPEQKLKEQFADEFERLRQVGKVLDVRVVDGAVLVYTDTLFATNPETNVTHELGKFMIYIRMDGRDDGVRWLNSTRRVDALRPGMNAHNVYSDGKACTDEMKQTLLELIARCEFAVVAELAIQFVETVNDDELGKYIDHWPSVE